VEKCITLLFCGEKRWLARGGSHLIWPKLVFFCVFCESLDSMALLVVVVMFLKSMGHMGGFVVCLFRAAMKLLVFLARQRRGR